MSQRSSAIRQISAHLQRTTLLRLERHARLTGTKKGFIIEQALCHHLEALEALPADVVTPAVITVDKASTKRVLRRLTKPQAPTKALIALLSDHD